MANDEWWPWVVHDHSGMPVKAGAVVQIAYDGGNSSVVVAEDGPWWHGGGSKRWKGQRAHWCPIIRYRIRKPRGLIILQKLIENLPAPVREREDA